jgi:hypothetical protein
LSGLTPIDRFGQARNTELDGSIFSHPSTAPSQPSVIRPAAPCTLVPYAFEGISSWLQRLDRFAQVVERTKGAR